MVFSFKNDVTIRDINLMIFDGIFNGESYTLKESISQIRDIFRKARQNIIDVEKTKLKVLARQMKEIQKYVVSGKISYTEVFILPVYICFS